MANSTAFILVCIILGEVHCQLPVLTQISHFANVADNDDMPAIPGQHFSS